MPVALGDFFRITAGLLYKSNDEIQNVFYVRNNNGDPADDASVMIAAEEFLEDLYGDINPYISEQVTYNYINVFVPTGQQALGSFAWPSLTVGTATGEVTAPGVCQLSYARTGISRRIGKKYWGAFSEAHIANGVWDSAQTLLTQLAAQKTWGTFVTSFGLSLTGVIYDRLTGQGRGALSIVTSTIPAYQRRRKQGRGV